MSTNNDNIFGAYGDGGFITTNDEKVFDRMRRIRFLGMEKKKMSSGHWNENVAKGFDRRQGHAASPVLE